MATEDTKWPPLVMDVTQMKVGDLRVRVRLVVMTSVNIMDKLIQMSKVSRKVNVNPI